MSLLMSGLWVVGVGQVACADALKAPVVGGYAYTLTTGSSGTGVTTVNQPMPPEPRSEELDYYDPLESFRMALLRQVKYPNQALQMGHEGTVMIRVQLTGNGQVRPVRIVRSAGPLLDAAVLQAVDEIMQRKPLSISREVSILRTMDFPVVFRP